MRPDTAGSSSNIAPQAAGWFCRQQPGLEVILLTAVDPPTGPTLLSGGDMAGILSRVFSRTVRLVPTPLWLFLKAAYLYGEPVPLLGYMEHCIEEHRRGAFAIGRAPSSVGALPRHVSILIRLNTYF